MPAEILRAMYCRGLELLPSDCAAFLVLAPDGDEVTIVVRNGADGFVEVACPHEQLRAEIGKFVGFRVAKGNHFPAGR